MPLHSIRRSLGAVGAALFLISRLPASGADAAASADSDVQVLAPVTVNDTSAPVPTQYQLPSPVEAISAGQIADTVNAVDVEDALKYLPDLFVRKRDDGDNQPVLATRDWGINSSARSLVFADGVLLSALIANNNSIGAPRWGMVAPDEIQSVDVIYGPYAAAYAGNSEGAVVEITTRMPDHFESSVSTTESWQPFSLYSTKNTYDVNQTAVTVGDRAGKWSFWVTADNEDSNDQPLLFVTASSLPAGTTGGYIAWNKLGQAADVLGASGIQDANLVTLTTKVAYDFSSNVRATYTFGLWDTTYNATVQTYLRDVDGAPTFASVAGFASGYYNWIEEHTMQSLTLKSSGAGDWDWEIIGSDYDFDKDTEKTPASASSTGTTLSTNGKVALLGGSGWMTLDAKAAWHPLGRNGGQELSFGAHFDEEQLVNPTYNTPDWLNGRAFSSLASEGNGDTSTSALWAQDVWRIAPQWVLTVGGRYEWWEAFDGINVSGATTVVQPQVNASDFSPKATLAWTPAKDWTITLFSGEAYRYPTAGELYQLVTTGSTFTSPNPNLLPENDWSEELRAEDKLGQDGLVRFSLFEDDTTNALVSQYQELVPGSSTVYSYVQNVGHIRNRGAEVYADRNNVLVPGLELSGNITYVDSRITADAGEGQFSTAVGKKAPYVPMWRGTAEATYRLSSAFAWTVAGRYQGQMYSTVDNTDINPNAYQGFDEFFVLDTHLRWNPVQRLSVSGGVDNILDRKYFLFHPFPQRTVVGELKYSF